MFIIIMQCELITVEYSNELYRSFKMLISSMMWGVNVLISFWKCEICERPVGRFSVIGSMLSIFKVALDLREGIYTSISFELECIFRTVANTTGESEYSLSFDKWELV